MAHNKVDCRSNNVPDICNRSIAKSCSVDPPVMWESMLKQSSGLLVWKTNSI